MGDHLRVDKPCRYANMPPGQLSLAIPAWVGAMSTGENWAITDTPHITLAQNHSMCERRDLLHT